MVFDCFRLERWKSISLMEFGFLWSVLFAVWGPVPRYLGWLIALIGLFLECIRGHGKGSSLHPKVQFLLIFLLVWGVFPSYFRKPDFYSFIKGYSLVLEFAFSLWLSARLFGEEAFQRFWVVLVMTVFVVIIQSLYAFFFENNFSGLFSNINTLGLYGVILLPFFISRAFEKGKVLFWVGSAGVLFLICLSSSSGAWLTGAACLFFLTLLGGKKYFAKIFFLFLLFVTMFAAVWGVLEKTDPELKRQFANYMKREYQQLTAFDNPSKLTTYRSFLWKGALHLIKVHPLAGWGWGSFNSPFEQVNKSWWNEKQTRISLKYVDDAHNMYFNLSIYGGIPSMIAVVVIFLFTAYRAFFFSRQNPERRWFWVAASACILSLLVYSFGGDVFSIRYRFACIFWYFMGFAGRAAEK